MHKFPPLYKAEWSILGKRPPVVTSVFCSGSLRRFEAPDACLRACSSSTKLQSRGLIGSRLSGAAFISGAAGSGKGCEGRAATEEWDVAARSKGDFGGGGGTGTEAGLAGAEV